MRLSSATVTAAPMIPVTSAWHVCVESVSGMNRERGQHRCWVAGPACVTDPRVVHRTGAAVIDGGRVLALQSSCRCCWCCWIEERREEDEGIMDKNQASRSIPAALLRDRMTGTRERM